MTRTATWMLCLLSLVAIGRADARQSHTFAQFETSPVYQGRIASPKLRTGEDKRYPTMIRKAVANGKINFAGHFVLSAFGCGSSCVQVFALNARTGEVHWLPFTVSWRLEDKGFDTDILPLDYRVDSRLLIVQGSRDEHGHGTYAYVFEQGRFRLLDAREDPPNGLWN